MPDRRDSDSISSRRSTLVSPSQNPVNAPSGVKGVKPKEFDKNDLQFNLSETTSESDVSDDVLQTSILSDNAIDQYGNESDASNKLQFDPSNKIRESDVSDDVLQTSMLSDNAVEQDKDDKGQVRIQDLELQSMIKPYWKRWWAGVTFTAAGGLAAGIVGILGVAGALISLPISGTVAAIGGSCLMLHVNVKNGLQSGRQHFRDQWKQQENGEWLTGKQAEWLSGVSSDEWNRLLDFRVSRGFFRRGFTAKQRQTLTDHVMKAVLDGVDLSVIEAFVRQVNENVVKRGFDFDKDSTVQALGRLREFVGEVTLEKQLPYY